MRDSSESSEGTVSAREGAREVTSSMMVETVETIDWWTRTAAESSARSASFSRATSANCMSVALWTFISVATSACS